MSEVAIKQRLSRARHQAKKILNAANYNIIFVKSDPFDLLANRKNEIRHISIVLDEITNHDIGGIKNFLPLPRFCTAEIWCKKKAAQDFIQIEIEEDSNDSEIIAIGHTGNILTGKKESRNRLFRLSSKPGAKEYYLEKYNWTCQKCKRKLLDGKKFHVHHEVFLSKGGEDVESNLTLLCIECHQGIHLPN